jgi:hypothetical protein
MMTALVSDPKFRQGVGLIVDHTNVDISALTAAEIEQAADLRTRFAGDVVPRAAGVVGPGSPMRYGLGRMFEAFVELQPGTDITLFETVEEAIAWLRGPDSAAPTAP